MSTIHSLSTGGYYQLPGQSKNTGSTGFSGSANSNSMASLADILGQSATDVVDLSPRAQQLLDLYNQNAASTSSAGQDSFLLGRKEQLAQSAIIARYKDLPLTQENFDALQDDLHAAGLSPDQLAQKDASASFSTTQTLIDALSGKSTPIASATDATRQAKKDNYIDSIVSQWKNLAGPDKASA